MNSAASRRGSSLQWVVSWKYNVGVLLGMVEAFMAKTKRIEKGKSLRNMEYPSVLSDFYDAMACLSPQNYSTF